MIKLDYSDNLLTQLLELPSDLQILDCSSNKLSTLPELPAGLLMLDCSYNRLVCLPKLPGGLQILICDNNWMVAFPELPPSLQILIFDNNPIYNSEVIDRSFPTLLEISIAGAGNTGVAEIDLLKKSICDVCHRNTLLRNSVIMEVTSFGIIPISKRLCYLCIWISN